MIKIEQVEERASEGIAYRVATGSGSCATKHLIPVGETKSICGHITGKTSMDGTLSQQATYPFRGFDRLLSPHNMCSKCENKIRENGLNSKTEGDTE